MENENQIVGSQPIEAPLAPPVTTGETKPPEAKVDLPPDPAAVQAEIDRLQKVREKAEADAQYWRKQKAEARADYFKSRSETPPPTPPPAAAGDLGIGPEPNKNDFDDYDQYVGALTDWKVEKKRAEWERDQQQKLSDSRRQEKRLSLQEKINVGYQEFTDFEEVALDPAVPITPMIAEIMGECEHPHKIAYYLGKNRTETIKIAKMNPIQAAREIARIEAEIAKAVTPPTVPPKIPSAPPPIRPVGSSHTVAKPIEKMSQKEYEEWANSNPRLRRF